MVSFWDFLGIGSKRRSALQAFDGALTRLEVNPAYLDDGMRFLIYKWAEAASGGADEASSRVDLHLSKAAELISYCVLGPTETEALWGAAVRQERQQRFDDALAHGHAESFDVGIIKLVLAKGAASPEISAHATLD